MANAWPKERRLLGTKVQRIDGPEKSTGIAKYSFDINRPGMLHAIMLRCPYAHAKIKSLDASAAEKMPGVKALYILGDTYTATVVSVESPKNTVVIRVRQGERDVDKPLEVVRGVRLLRSGEAVAPGDLKPNDTVTVQSNANVVGRELDHPGDEILGIAADTEEHARDAARAVKIDYEFLDFLVKEEDALKDPTKNTLSGGGPNVPKPNMGTTGDVGAAFEQAAAVHEGRYGVATISHQCLESHGLVAEWDADGNLTVWCSTQATSGTAQGLAKEFKVPVSKVKCITHYMGGGFGSKFGPDIQGFVAAHLARKAKAPVKLMLERADEIMTGGCRPSAYGKIKIAGTKDGKITAYEVDCYGSPGVAGGSTVNFQLLPYVYNLTVPNVRKQHTVVRLNSCGGRAMRAPGHPQNCMLTDTAVDDLAAKLGIDPLLVRLKNLPPNQTDALKKDPTSFNGLRQTIYEKEIEIAAQLSEWKNKWHPPGKGPNRGPIKHGMGMALHTWGGTGFPGNQINTTISSDGSILVTSSTQDLGTGQRTVLAIIAAETLGLDVKDITIRIGETQYGPCTGSGGSTTCPATSPACLNSVSTARDALFEKIAARLNAKAGDLAIELGKIVDKANNKSWAWKEACAKLGMETASGSGGWTAGLSSQGVGGVQIAEVEVDTETGVVRCTKFYAVQDCGLIVNKLCCESQVAGGVIMGVNYALFEENILDRHTGRQVNPNMEFYKLGGIEDMPKIVVHMHDMPERGVIGIGEPPTISTAAAISNAIFNALGVRVPNAPFTPERVLAVLANT